MSLRAANVLFDLDGTLTDSRPGILKTIQHAMRSVGIEPPPENDLLWCVGPPLREIFGRLLPRGEALVIERAVSAYVERYRVAGYHENRVYPDVPEMLAALAARKRLVLVTAKHTDSAERILTLFNLREHFSAVFGSEPSGRLADKKDLVRHVLDELALERSETIIVGDRVHDIEGGIHNGIQAIGASWGYGSGDELAGAGHICRSPSEVLALLSE
ncbi:MAG: HAD hydrolase-like protein [Candidatus Binataceae bacterium]